MRPDGFRAAGLLIAAAAHGVGAQSVGGPVMAAIPLACAAIAVAEGDDLVGFFVRKERKEHGLQRWVEGPVEAGTSCLVVEDTVTTGGSTVRAIERMREERTKKATRFSPAATEIAAQAGGIAAVAGPPTASAPTSPAMAAISSPAARKPAGRSRARRAST